jgi:hypothetical protein
MLSDQGSNLDSSDPESDVLPITPSDNYSLEERKIIQIFERSIRNTEIFYAWLDFVQVSFRATVRLNTKFVLVESGSTQKYPSRSN